jgi:hypothetical protein
MTEAAVAWSGRLRGAMGLAAQEALKQPTWCRLQPDMFDALVSHAHATYPENILFVAKDAGGRGNATAAATPAARTSSAPDAANATEAPRTTGGISGGLKALLSSQVGPLLICGEVALVLVGVCRSRRPCARSSLRGLGCTMS